MTLPSHVIKCAGAPTEKPTAVGQHWINTLTGEHFLSNGTVSTANWILFLETPFQDPMTSRGDVIIRNAANVTARLGIGTSGQVMKSDGTDVTWEDEGATVWGQIGGTLSDQTDLQSALDAIQDDVDQNILDIQQASIASSTAWLSGCEISVNAGDPALLDMDIGTGIHFDNTSTPGKAIITLITIPERIGVAITDIGTQLATSLSIDISGNIIQQANTLSPTERRDRFTVGAVIHTDNATIVDLVPAYIPGFDTHAQLVDLMRAIGFFLTGGNTISGVTSTLSIQKAAGTGFAAGGNAFTNVNDPHDVTLIEQNPINFFTIDQLGVVAGITTFLDPTSYDNAGTPTTVPANNNATIKYLYLFASGAMSVLQGQEVFSNFASAVDASGTEEVIVPSLLSTGILLARIVMTKTSTDTTDTSNVRIIPTNAIASGGSGGAATTMQQSYDISVAPQVTLTAGLGGIEYQDAATPIGASLFKVSNNGGATDFIDVDAEKVTVIELVSDGLTASRAVAADANKKLVSSATTLAELDFVAGVDSNIQDQIDAKPDNFKDLPDTPSTIALADAGKFVTVNAAGDALEFSGSELWTPTDLSVEPISWVDASDESTITESGGNVSQIDDKTSNGNDLSQGTGSRQPETGQTLNGLNVLTFDHTTSEALVHNTFPIPTSRDISVFTVQSYTGGGGSVSDSLFSMDSSTADWQVAADNTAQFDGRVNSTGMGGSSTQNWTGGPFNGPSIYNAYFNKTGNGRGAYVDGVEVTTEEVYTTGMDASQQFRIMANRGNTGSISGILAEMVIVEDQSLATRQLIEGYLKWKWNLSALPSGHPYEFAAPTIETGAGGGFTNLRDTPGELGAPGQIVQVNAAGDALEFKENLIVTAPDLGRWRILVDNAGVLSTELE